jgi:DNA repair photolyase
VFQIFGSQSSGILTRTSGFIAEAGFTHSLTPARNCTFACTYCYVPTMGLYGGLKREDREHWGQFTTFKTNAAELLAHALRPQQLIYCSPLVDPYQPAEGVAPHMPYILERLTTDDERARQIYEPLCASIAERLDTVDRLRKAGIETRVTMAPLLPSNPERLVALAIEVSERNFICDPFHTRENKPGGATTREAGVRVNAHYGFENWQAFQEAMIARFRTAAETRGRRLGVGWPAFGWLAKGAACAQAT